MNVTIAEVLHRAADHWLAVDGDDYEKRSDSDRYSCCAVGAAVDELCGFNQAFEDQIYAGLEQMGLDTESGLVFRKLGYPDEMDHTTQGARYAWLKFAALIAEEQGV